METTKKYYLPGPEITESLYVWLKEKAEKNRRSLTQQLLCELENNKKEDEALFSASVSLHK